jgi:hypothetical protein
MVNAIDNELEPPPRSSSTHSWGKPARCRSDATCTVSPELSSRTVHRSLRWVSVTVGSDLLGGLGPRRQSNRCFARSVRRTGRASRTTAARER